MTPLRPDHRSGRQRSSYVSILRTYGRNSDFVSRSLDCLFPQAINWPKHPQTCFLQSSTRHNTNTTSATITIFLTVTGGEGIPRSRESRPLFSQSSATAKAKYLAILKWTCKVTELHTVIRGVKASLADLTACRRLIKKILRTSHRFVR